LSRYFAIMRERKSHNSTQIKVATNTEELRLTLLK